MSSLSEIIQRIDRLVTQRAEPNEIKGQLSLLSEQAEALERDAKKKGRSAQLEKAKAEAERAKAESKAQTSNAEQNAHAQIAKAQQNAKAEIARAEQRDRAVIERLEAELAKARAELQRLQTRTAELEKKPADQQGAGDADEWSKEAREILRMLGAQSEPVSAEWISGELRYPTVLVEHLLLDVMLEREFVRQRFVSSDPTGEDAVAEWYLDKNGRTFIAKHGLFLGPPWQAQKEEEKKKYKDLPPIEHQILLILKETENGATQPEIKELLTLFGHTVQPRNLRHILDTLSEDAKLDHAFAAGVLRWSVSRPGIRYLAERDLL